MYYLELNVDGEHPVPPVRTSQGHIQLQPFLTPRKQEKTCETLPNQIRKTLQKNLRNVLSNRQMWEVTDTLNLLQGHIQLQLFLTARKQEKTFANIAKSEKVKAF